MPRATVKKTSVRKNKALVDEANTPAVAPVAGRILEMRPAAVRARHGLAPGSLILILLTIGCLAATFLMYDKLNSVIGYATGASASLAASQKRAAELRDELDTIKTLQELAKKSEITAAPTVPADLVWDEYTSPNISIKYPHGYTLDKATPGFPALTIKSDKGRIEIFREKDFSGGSRVFGLEEGELPTQAEIDGYVPKDMKTIGSEKSKKIVPYSVWIYYATGDEVTRLTLEQAVASLKVLK